jgi:hypothetical protein
MRPKSEAINGGEGSKANSQEQESAAPAGRERCILAESVRELAAAQLTVKEIAAVERCDPDMISTHFANEFCEGRLVGQARIKQALYRNAIENNNVKAQVFLMTFHAKLETASEAHEPLAREANDKAREENRRMVIELLQQFPDLDTPELREILGWKGPNKNSNTVN